MSTGAPVSPVKQPGAQAIDKDPRRIAGMFDAIARRYDLLNHLLSAGFDFYWRRVAVASLDLRDGARVLDVCTGTADLAMSLSRCRPAPSFVLGLDFSGGMLLLGQRKLRLAGLDRVIHLVRGDACQLPCPSGAFDAVTIGFGIRNVSETAQAVGEICRVLKPGGQLAILEFGEPNLPVLRSIYLWYFRRILPLFGRLLSKHREAYAYLPASVGAFLSPGALSALLRDSGFSGVSVVRLTCGVVYLHVCRKDTGSFAGVGRVSGEPAVY